MICNVLKEGHIDFFPERKVRFEDFKTKRLKTICKDLKSYYEEILEECKRKANKNVIVCIKWTEHVKEISIKEDLDNRVIISSVARWLLKSLQQPKSIQHHVQSPVL